MQSVLCWDTHLLICISERVGWPMSDHVMAADTQGGQMVPRYIILDPHRHLYAIYMILGYV